ncbi:SCO-spondin [Magallana gigas]|uniref:SCO-spondin n=1 Tax=Magallana gigas TaxID=29159 RepID=UPI00333FC44D
MESYKYTVKWICLVFTVQTAVGDVQLNKVRLVNGNSSAEGRVEVFYNGEWGTVCDDNFDDKDAGVVCSMLGYNRINAKAKHQAFFGIGVGQIWMDELQCTDADADLFHCSQRPLGFHNCGHNEDAGVVCNFDTAPNIRLMGGTSPMEGRVEIYYNKEWGTLCDDSWDSMAASVVCFMLGFSRENAIPKPSAYFGQGRGRIWMDDIVCQGTERDLFHCNKSSVGTHNCGHSEDAGVICSLEGAVRLAQGSSSLEGRVEIYSDGSWGTVCDDLWDNDDAAVVCSMLGFQREGAVAKKGGEFRSGVGDIMLDDVQCKGTERSIYNCSHRGLRQNNCRHIEDAGVVCKEIQTGGAVRDCGAADILIMMDETGTVGPYNFNTMKMFVKEFIRGLNSLSLRFSALTFSSSVTKIFGFRNFSSLSVIMSEIDRVRYSSGGSTETDKALRYARTSMFNTTRTDASKVVILITDGVSTNQEKTQEEAALLRSQGVRIFSIGVGRSITKEGLSLIASLPSDEHVFQVSSFNTLSQILSVVQNRTCAASNVNGGWNSWSSWSACNVSCGGGNRERSRICNNPVPRNNGRPCLGAENELDICNMTPCPVDGGFTEWTSWSHCTKSCGGGTKNRNRTCTNPRPRYGGLPCSGLYFEYGSCNNNFCPVNGGFSDWSVWTSCTDTCGGGLSSRKRFCNNPEPQYEGDNCTGLFEETRICNKIPCPIDGGFSEWNMWSVCSVSCGGGLKSRKRTCTNPLPQYGGQNCSDSFDESDTCNTSPCPVNGGFGNWGLWSGCSRSCGGGSRERMRVCNSPTPAHGGENCIGNTSQIIWCNEFPCPVDGRFTEWSIWTDCSQSCGGGVVIRNRSCSNPPPQHGGKPCNGHFSESLNCNVHQCPIDGGFSLWSAWSLCTVSCGGGTSIRSRSCTNPSPLYGGKNCVGAKEQIINCSIQHCPIDGKYSDWTAWSSCPHSCGGGFKSRLRRCNNPPPQYGGKQCSGNDKDYSKCNTQPCPINGAFGEWQAWSPCSHSCGGGNKKRLRQCNNPFPAFGGKNCTGLFHESSDCNLSPCPINGGFSFWSEWSQCSETCGGGVQGRNRSCTNPVPLYGGTECDGQRQDFLECNTHKCPIDGKYSDWGAWTSCSVTCGGGTQLRKRTCTNPPPQFGGKECSNESEQSEICNTNNCPVDGTYSDWSAWMSCTVTCGGGTQLRKRTCTNPSPQFGGKPCAGPANEITECNTKPCSICKNPAKEFECLDKVKCVADEYKCDGLPDCDDASDELPVLCSRMSGSGSCPEGLHSCPDGSCVSSSFDC